MTLLPRLVSSTLLLSLMAHAAEGPSTASEEHGGAILTVLFGFIVMLLAAKLGGHVAHAVGGELLRLREDCGGL